MNVNKTQNYRKAVVLFKDIRAGIVEETENGFRFTYTAEFANKGVPISISLPVKKESYESEALFPFFKALLPEGWYMDLVTSQLKIDENDSFGLLLATCKDTIGAVSIEEIPQ